MGDCLFFYLRRHATMASFLIQPDHAMTPILAFDIETIPDVNGIRQLYDLPADLPDNEVVLFAQQQRRAKTGSDFMQHHLHQVVAISC